MAQRMSLIVPSSPSDPSTPKRRRIVPDIPEPALSRTSTPRKGHPASRPATPERSLGVDSGLGTSVSPEKAAEDSSQTQPESPRWLVSSQTEPESSQWVVKTQHYRPPSSQTQPESPQWLVGSQLESQTQPESPRWLVKTQLSPQSSQTEPESSQWRVESPQPESKSSQTEPESSQWIVGTQLPSPTRLRPRMFLEDDQDNAPPGTLPVADYDSQSQAEPPARSKPSEFALPAVSQDEEESQPWEMNSPARKEMLRKLGFLRRQQKEDWDSLSDAPPSIPSDFGGVTNLEGLDTQDLLASPVQEFLALR